MKLTKEHCMSYKWSPPRGRFGMDYPGGDMERHRASDWAQNVIKRKCFVLSIWLVMTRRFLINVCAPIRRSLIQRWTGFHWNDYGNWVLGDWKRFSGNKTPSVSTLLHSGTWMKSVTCHIIRVWFGEINCHVLHRFPFRTRLVSRRNTNFWWHLPGPPLLLRFIKEDIDRSYTIKIPTCLLFYLRMGRNLSSASKGMTSANVTSW